MRARAVNTHSSARNCARYLMTMLSGVLLCSSVLTVRISGFLPVKCIFLAFNVPLLLLRLCVFVFEHYSGGQIKKTEMGKVRSTYGGEEI